MASIARGILMIGAGLGLMGFGLLLFYTFLPLFYGLFGAGLGYWLGLSITGQTVLTAGWFEFILAIAVGVAFAAVAYWIEPIRRVLAGIQVGSLAGLVIGYALDIGTVLELLLAVLGAIAGVILALKLFNVLVAIISAFIGSAIAIDGAYVLFPNAPFLNRFAALSRGGLIAIALWVALAVVAAIWQYSRLGQWAEREV